MGTKLNHLPSREELKRLRERWAREDADDIPLRDFDTTLTSGIEGTINQLGIFAQRSSTRGSVEAENAKLDAIKQLTAELTRQAEALAKVVATLNTKASKATVRKFETDLAAKHVRSVDNLFKLVAIIGTLLGALIAYKGHS